MLSHNISDRNEVHRNSETETGKLETIQEIEYRPPQVIAVGKAIDLLQGYSGKHTDNYSGYYWNGEG
jgi:hypothetical protein